jgi:hypothetical protein
MSVVLALTTRRWWFVQLPAVIGWAVIWTDNQLTAQWVDTTGFAVTATSMLVLGLLAERVASVTTHSRPGITGDAARRRHTGSEPQSWPDRPAAGPVRTTGWHSPSTAGWVAGTSRTGRPLPVRAINAHQPASSRCSVRLARSAVASTVSVAPVSVPSAVGCQRVSTVQ